MVQTSLASSRFLLPTPGDAPPHDPRPLSGLISQPGSFSWSRALSSTVLDRPTGKAAAGLWSNSRLWQCRASRLWRLEEHQMVKTSKGRNYEHSQKTEMVLCLAKCRHLNQLPEVCEITGLGTQPKHLLTTKGCASWGGAKGPAAQLNRRLLVSDNKCLQMSFQNPP